MPGCSSEGTIVRAFVKKGPATAADGEALGDEYIRCSKKSYIRRHFLDLTVEKNAGTPPTYAYGSTERSVLYSQREKLSASSRVELLVRRHISDHLPPYFK
ncbi:hypothetical protein KM043_017140 [Ampulex compressa]|nr:hypothetical protein KM043_017140 [Ampulex compressa]